MSQRDDDVFDDAFRQGRDRQEGIDFECGPDDRSVRDIKPVVHHLCIVAKHFPEVVHHALASVLAYRTSTNGCAVTSVFQGERCQIAFSINEASKALA